MDVAEAILESYHCVEGERLEVTEGVVVRPQGVSTRLVNSTGIIIYADIYAVYADWTDISTLLGDIPEIRSGDWFIVRRVWIHVWQPNKDLLVLMRGDCDLVAKTQWTSALSF